MNKRTFSKKLQKRLVAITLSFTLITASLTATYGYISYRSILQEKLSQTTSVNLKFLAKTIQSDLDTAINLAAVCTSNEAIGAYLNAANQDQADTKKLAWSAWNRVEEEYRNNHSNLYIVSVIISDLNDHFIMFNSRDVTHKLPVSKVIEESSFFQKLYHSEHDIETGFVQNPFTPYIKNTQVLPILRPIYTFYGQQEAGWCCLFLSPSLFTNHMQNYELEPDSPLYLSLGDTCYLWDGRNLTKTILPENAKEMISYQPDNENWYLLQPISQSALSKQTLIYMSTLLGLIATVTILGFAITLYYHRSINVPIKKLLQKLQQVSKGNFDPNPEIEWDNELGEIGCGINSMGQNITQLIETKTKDQKKKYELEYEILRNQVNPHFLYNTLNSISWMATIQGAKGIMEMTTSLSLLLKSISKKNGTTHSLRDEVELLNHYFLILKYRYGGRLTMNITVEQDELYDNIVPQFILQIIVENAIFHGIEPKGNRGIIDIVIRSIHDGQDIFLSITDNGIGMTAEQIDKTLSTTPDTSDLFRKIGIHNLQERIRYTYGADYGITIESVPGEHTTVNIIIPFRKEVTADV